MYQVTVDVTARGPLFDGRADGYVAGYATEARQEVARYAKNRWTGQLVQVIRRPTPYYWTQLRVDERPGASVVHDGGMVYGPWLEGTSSRNRTTRFKGYRSARIVTQQVQARAVEIAESVLPRWLARMRGQ